MPHQRSLRSLAARSGASVVIMPPSPAAKFFTAWNDQQAAIPCFPAPRLPHACAQSSMVITPGYPDGIRTVPPYHTGMTARVFLVCLSATSYGSRHRVSSSMSAKTILAPLWTAASPVEANVSAGMMISPPRTPSAWQVNWRAIVALFTATA